MFNSLVLSFSRLPMALAADGLMPKALGYTHPKTGAPIVSILVLGTAWALSLGMSFERLVLLDIFLYGLSLVLEFAAFVMLRIKEPDLPRPYRVPGGLLGAILLGAFPCIYLIVALIRNRDESVWGINALLFGALVSVAGTLLYVPFRARAR
jgi:amino acid transporter